MLIECMVVINYFFPLEIILANKVINLNFLTFFTYSTVSAKYYFTISILNFFYKCGFIYLPPLTKAEYAATKFNSVVSSDPNEEASKGGKSPSLNL